MAFTFRPLTPEDLPMLDEWLHCPHVRQWWRERGAGFVTIGDVETPDGRVTLMRIERAIR